MQSDLLTHFSLTTTRSGQVFEIVAFGRECCLFEYSHGVRLCNLVDTNLLSFFLQLKSSVAKLVNEIKRTANITAKNSSNK